MTPPVEPDDVPPEGWASVARYLVEAFNGVDGYDPSDEAEVLGALLGWTPGWEEAGSMDVLDLGRGDGWPDS